MSLLRSAGAGSFAIMGITLLEEFRLGRGKKDEAATIAQAQSYFNKALKLNPTSVGACYMMMVLGNRDESIVDGFLCNSHEDMTKIPFGKNFTIDDFQIKLDMGFSVTLTTSDYIGIYAYQGLRKTAAGKHSDARALLDKAWAIIESLRQPDYPQYSFEFLRVATARHFQIVGDVAMAKSVLEAQPSWSDHFARSLANLFYAEIALGEQNLAVAEQSFNNIFQLQGDWHIHELARAGLNELARLNASNRLQHQVVSREALDRAISNVRNSAVEAPVHDDSDASKRDAILRQAEAELAGQVGLASVKDKIEGLQATAWTARVRQAQGFQARKANHHLIFTGPPGTGKTTIARIVAKYYYGLGILSEAKVKEASRADFVGMWQGHTAEKTRELIESSLGGVLFIDEAYSLTHSDNADSDSFGKEAVEELLKMMEDHQHNLVVIIAGYDTHIDKFLESNPGLPDRFSNRIQFDSYDVGELADIFLRMSEKEGASLTEQAFHAVCNVFAKEIERCDREVESGAAEVSRFGNARLVRRLVSQALEIRERAAYRANKDLPTEMVNLNEEMVISDEDVWEAYIRIRPA